MLSNGLGLASGVAQNGAQDHHQPPDHHHHHQQQQQHQKDMSQHFEPPSQHGKAKVLVDVHKALLLLMNALEHRKEVIQQDLIAMFDAVSVSLVLENCQASEEREREREREKERLTVDDTGVTYTGRFEP